MGFCGDPYSEPIVAGLSSGQLEVGKKEIRGFKIFKKN